MYELKYELKRKVVAAALLVVAVGVALYLMKMGPVSLMVIGFGFLFLALQVHKARSGPVAVFGEEGVRFEDSELFRWEDFEYCEIRVAGGSKGVAPVGPRPLVGGADVARGAGDAVGYYAVFKPRNSAMRVVALSDRGVSPYDFVEMVNRAAGRPVIAFDKEGCAAEYARSRSKERRKVWLTVAVIAVVYGLVFLLSWIKGRSGS